MNNLPILHENMLSYSAHESTVFQPCPALVSDRL
jgi:hypothetical protein